jgi:hypothetical protein
MGKCADFIKKPLQNGMFLVIFMKICLPFQGLLAIINIYVNMVESESGDDLNLIPADVGMSFIAVSPFFVA